MMAPRDVVVECFRLRERVDPDRVPRVRSVMRIARECGAKFRNDEAARWLAPFVKTAKVRIGENAPREHEKRSPGSSREKTGSTPGAPDQNSGSTPNAPREHEKRSPNAPVENPGSTPGAPSRARDKVSQVSMIDVPHGTSDEPPRRLAAAAKRTKPKQPKLDMRTDAERTADAAIVELHPLVEPTLEAMTWKTWTTRNRQSVVDMARAGMTSDAIVSAWQRESESLGEPIRLISFLQARLNAATDGFRRSASRNPAGRAAQLDLARRYMQDERDPGTEAQRDFVERYVEIETANAAPVAPIPPESNRPAVDEAPILEPQVQVQDKDADADARIALLSEADRSWLAERARAEPGAEYARRNVQLSQQIIEQIVRTTERRIVLASFDEHGKRRESAA